MLLSDDLEDKENLLGREKEDDVSLDDKSGSCCVCLSRPATVSSLNRHDVNWKLSKIWSSGRSFYHLTHFLLSPDQNICCQWLWWFPSPGPAEDLPEKKLVLIQTVVNMLGKTSIEKKTFSFGHCPNHLNPPPWPQFGQLGPLFSHVKIQDLKVNLKQPKTTLNNLKQPKKTI